LDDNEFFTETMIPFTQVVCNLVGDAHGISRNSQSLSKQSSDFNESISVCFQDKVLAFIEFGTLFLVASLSATEKRHEKGIGACQSKKRPFSGLGGCRIMDDSATTVGNGLIFPIFFVT
jgi:hypothetical protein